MLFFVLAFLLPWLVWATSIAEAAHVIGWHVPQSLAFWLGLTIATYVSAAVTGGRRAVLDLLLRMILVRVNWRWYLAALLVTPVLAVIAGGVGSLIGEPPALADASAVSVLLLLLFNVWMWLITEETAWRGFALPRLQRRFNPLTASLVLGVLWAAWHIPLFLIPGTFQSAIPFAGFAISTIATSVLIGWVFNQACGSVLLAAIFHGVTDVTIAVCGVMSDGLGLFWTFVVVQVLAAASVSPTLARMPRAAVSTPEFHPVRAPSRLA